MKNGKSNLRLGRRNSLNNYLGFVLLLTASASLIFSGCRMGGTKVNPNSSGAVKVIRTSELQKPQKEEPAMNILPNGGVAPNKPNVTSEELPAPAPPPPTVQKNKVDIVIKEPENGPAVPILVTSPMTTLERVDKWIDDHGTLICYYLMVFTFVCLTWVVWSIHTEKRVILPAPKKPAKRNKKMVAKKSTKKPAKKTTKKPAKKTTKKPTAKKAVKKTAKKKAAKKTS